MKGLQAIIIISTILRNAQTPKVAFLGTMALFFFHITLGETGVLSYRNNSELADAKGTSDINLVENNFSSPVDTLFDSIYIEAEYGDVELPMRIKDDSTASGHKYVEVDSGYTSTSNPPDNGKITIEVLLDSGNYKIWGRVITPSGGDDSFWVQVDGGTAYEWNKIGTKLDWTWVAVQDDNNNSQVVTWSLTANTHTITIYYREDGAKIDEIYITKHGDTPTRGNDAQSEQKTIYISQESGIDEDNDGTNLFKPLKTLSRAYEIATNTKNEVGKYNILLKGGETYSTFSPQEVDLYENGNINTFALIWDIDRELTISTYGSSEKALLRGGAQKSGGGPTQAILVIAPSTQAVLIENLSFKMWQEGTIMVFESEDVTIRNIKIDSIGTYFIPDHGIPEGADDYPYAAGIIYPKNSTRVLIEYVEMSNCHNRYESVDALHGFYCTRLNHSEIRFCYLKNVSGSPFKFRRSPANNCYVHDNECYYTGHTEHNPDDLNQPGFLRYSGDPGGNCPYNLVFENNIFHYPYCWPDKEDCHTAKAVLCSISNKESCGEYACWNDTTKVKWINNDIKYHWEPDTTVSKIYESFLAKDFQVSEIIPNPFTDMATLELVLYKAASVNVSVLNTQGQVIYTVINKKMIVGKQTVQLNLQGHSQRAMTPGIYFCRIKVDNTTEYRKMIQIAH